MGGDASAVEVVRQGFLLKGGDASDEYMNTSTATMWLKLVREPASCL